MQHRREQQRDGSSAGPAAAPAEDRPPERECGREEARVLQDMQLTARERSDKEEGSVPDPQGGRMQGPRAGGRGQSTQHEPRGQSDQHRHQRGPAPGRQCPRPAFQGPREDEEGSRQDHQHLVLEHVEGKRAPREPVER